MEHAPANPVEKPLLKALKGTYNGPPPLWLMRQAGRYLPEYRETRKQAGSFLELCYNSELAAEVTLQPLRRFKLEASIVFADILLLPHALGQNLQFLEGEGPKLDAIQDLDGLKALKPEKIHEGLSPVYETISRLKKELAPETTLFGFAGAPWTVALYMLGGKGSGGHEATRLWAYRNPDLFSALLDMLVDTTSSYLQAQVRAGADILQLFDSWAGGLPPSAFQAWCVEPTKRIVELVKAEYPDVPIVGFPRSSGPLARPYALQTGVDAVSLDTGMDPEWAAETLQPILPVQGNLDPMALVAGGDMLRQETLSILDRFKGGRHIFNLGHGIVPQTPPEHVAELRAIIDEWFESK